MPISTIAPINTLLRPSRSASGPARSAPKASPNKAALRTGARSGLAICHSVTSEGAIKPIAAVSKPSRITTTTQIENTSQ